MQLILNNSTKIGNAIILFPALGDCTPKNITSDRKDCRRTTERDYFPRQRRSMPHIWDRIYVYTLHICDRTSVVNIQYTRMNEGKTGNLKIMFDSFFIYSVLEFVLVFVLNIFCSEYRLSLKMHFYTKINITEFERWINNFRNVKIWKLTEIQIYYWQWMCNVYHWPLTG